MNLTLISYSLVSNNNSPETFKRLEPVSITDLQTHSRLPTLLIPPGDDPLYIEGLISAAREQVEQVECRIQLLTAVYELRLDGLFDQYYRPDYYPIRLPKPPLQEVLSVKYIDTAGVEQTIYETSSPAIDDGLFVIDAKSPHNPQPAEIYLGYGQSWPSVRSEPNALRIRFRAGFGDTPADVPSSIRQWIMIMAGTMYEHREAEITGSIVQSLKFVDGLLDPWRAPRIVA